MEYQELLDMKPHDVIMEYWHTLNFNDRELVKESLLILWDKLVVFPDSISANRQIDGLRQLLISYDQNDVDKDEGY